MVDAAYTSYVLAVRKRNKLVVMLPIALPATPIRAKMILDMEVKNSSLVGKVWQLVAGTRIESGPQFTLTMTAKFNGHTITLELAPKEIPILLPYEVKEHRRSRKLIGKRGRTLGCKKFSTFRGDHMNKAPKPKPPKDIILFPCVPHTEEK